MVRSMREAVGREDIIGQDSPEIVSGASADAEVRSTSIRYITAKNTFHIKSRSAKQSPVPVQPHYSPVFPFLFFHTFESFCNLKRFRVLIHKNYSIFLYIPTVSFQACFSAMKDQFKTGPKNFHSLNHSPPSHSRNTGPPVSSQQHTDSRDNGRLCNSIISVASRPTPHEIARRDPIFHQVNEVSTNKGKRIKWIKVARNGLFVGTFKFLLACIRK